MIKYNKKHLYSLIPLAFFIAVLFTFIFEYNFFGQIHLGNQQFSELANSFLHHQFYFLTTSPYNQLVSDNVLFNNHFFWPLGPFPAIILMPFVWLTQLFGLYFYQGYLNFFLVVIIFYLIFKLARKINFTRAESTYWSAAFIFSSMFLGVALISSSWYFAQTVTVFLLFLALLEYFGKKRYFLIGVLFGFILLTRFTACIAILFFLLDILFNVDTTWRARLRNIINLCLAPMICLILLLGYNYVRFDEPFNQGYRAQILSSDFTNDKNNYGLFNIAYLPRGIYYSLINMPKPIISTETRLLSFPFVKADRWGMSIFLTSPYLLYLFFIKLKNKKAAILLITSVVIWFAIASSFFIGYTQFGFRYALDFMPLLFTSLMIAYKDSNDKMSLNLKIIIIVSAIFNLYLVLNI